MSGLITRNLFCDCVELQDQSLHALQKSIVQVSRDPLALFESLFHARSHLPRHLTQPQLVDPAEQHEKSDREQHPEPGGLVISRSDGEIEVGAGLVPHAAVIAGDHAETVVARRKIGIEDLPAIAGVLPIAVVAFQLVAKEYFLRRDQTERRVVYFQIARQWR